MLCTPEADSATSLRAREAEPPPVGQFWMLGGFYEMQEEEQDSSPFSRQLKKKKKIAIIVCYLSLHCPLRVKSTISRIYLH